MDKRLQRRTYQVNQQIQSFFFKYLFETTTEERNVTLSLLPVLALKLLWYEVTGITLKEGKWRSERLSNFLKVAQLKCEEGFEPRSGMA